MDYNTGQFISAESAIDDLLSREDDLFGLNKLKYMRLVKDVFPELNLSAIKQTKRKLYKIDPYTRSITFDDDYYAISTISGITRYGRVDPLVYNSNIVDDIVDIGLDTDCACGCTDALCSYQQQYETITEDVLFLMPDDTKAPYTRIIRKYINKDGSVYSEVTEPVAKYVDGSYDSVVVETTPSLLCKLEVRQCGCVVNNPYNLELWAKHANSLAPGHRPDILCEWGLPNPCYYPANATYNFSDDGRRIIFPPGFPYEKALIRTYTTGKTKDILLPTIAKEAFLSGIKRFETKFSKKATLAEKEEWRRNFNNDITVLQKKMNRLMLNEFYEYYFGRNATRDIYFNNNRNYEGYQFSF